VAIWIYTLHCFPNKGVTVMIGENKLRLIICYTLILSCCAGYHEISPATKENKNADGKKYEDVWLWCKKNFGDWTIVNSIQQGVGVDAEGFTVSGMGAKLKLNHLGESELLQTSNLLTKLCNAKCYGTRIPINNDTSDSEVLEDGACKEFVESVPELVQKLYFESVPPLEQPDAGTMPQRDEKRQLLTDSQHALFNMYQACLKCPSKREKNSRKNKIEKQCSDSCEKLTSKIEELSEEINRLQKEIEEQ